MNRLWYRRLGLVLLLVGALFVWRDRIAFELGYAYANGDFHGWTLARDDDKAAVWLRRAAEAGHARARYMLGLSYSRGWGVRRDDAEAERWFNLAADQGYAQACFHLAWMYHKGEGVARDEDRAQRLMARAAELGMADAALALARFRRDAAGRRAASGAGG
ncbi:MAG: tetratricopeptide repeat protein [Pseudomonadota bacterium]|nr:tetratricopeptide repeat protein [Pseudomonadota bacterium]MDP1902797.1 tetratricopeptide repeat protein [Pseudomonadota bacterium]MDP2354067.1 tetratricopeptide repeat protein [Pseudomonadota bacterium]